ncbi:hypothetical protein LINPERHAP1_LOCUS30861 [Linum perenne]
MQDDGTVNPRCPRISFSPDEIRSFYKPWSKALVVKVLERSFAYPVIKRRLESLWARAGHIQVSDMTNAFFLVRFSDDDDYQRAIFGGPWKISDYYITVARWSPDFNEEAPIRKVLTWVRLPKLPIHFLNATAVTRIGNHIGRTVRLDLATAEGARARYARVCVDIDLSKPLLGKYLLDERVMFIEYESLDNICFSCGMYGHKELDCQPKAPEEPGLTPEPVLPEPETKEPEGDSGSWMTVTRRNRKGGIKSDSRPRDEFSAGSQFSILSQADSAKPEKVKKPSVETASPVGKGIDHQASDHAAKLSKVLQAVLSSQDIPGPSKTKESSKHGSALIDVSNLKDPKKAPSVNTKEALDSMLIQVPINYGKPEFASNGSLDKPKAKPKKKQKENRSPPQEKKIQPSNQRRFVSKKGNAPVSFQSTKDVGIVDVPIGLGNGGRPPDASA